MESREIQDVPSILTEWKAAGFKYGLEDNDLGLFFEQYPDLVPDACFNWALHAMGRHYNHDPVPETRRGCDATEKEALILDEAWNFYLLTLGLVGFADARRLPSGSLWEFFWLTSIDEGPPCEAFERIPKRNRAAKVTRELYMRTEREIDQISRAGSVTTESEQERRTKRNLSMIEHNDSFNCVTWGNKEFVFKSGAPADCFRVMFNAWFIGKRWMDQKEILAMAETDGERLRDKFRDHPAWNLMIIPHPKTQGIFGLADPPSDSSS